MKRKRQKAYDVLCAAPNEDGMDLSISCYGMNEEEMILLDELASQHVSEIVRNSLNEFEYFPCRRVRHLYEFFIDKEQYIHGKFSIRSSYSYNLKIKEEVVRLVNCEVELDADVDVVITDEEEAQYVVTELIVKAISLYIANALSDNDIDISSISSIEFVNDKGYYEPLWANIILWSEKNVCLLYEEDESGFTAISLPRNY